MGAELYFTLYHAYTPPQSNMQMSLRQAPNATKELQASATVPKNAPLRTLPPPYASPDHMQAPTTYHTAPKFEQKQIRVLALGLNTSAEPLEDVAEALLPWSVASPEVSSKASCLMPY